MGRINIESGDTFFFFCEFFFLPNVPVFKIFIEMHLSVMEKSINIKFNIR